MEYRYCSKEEKCVFEEYKWNFEREKCVSMEYGYYSNEEKCVFKEYKWRFEEEKCITNA